jgi:hypothetical protein
MRVAISLFIVALAALYKGALWNFSTQSNKQIQQQLDKVPDVLPAKITKEMLEPLPAPVQKWLTGAGVVGEDQIRTVSLKQSGWMRLKPEQQKWTKAEAEQTITTDPPSFVWTVKMNPRPFVQVVGRDSFESGKAKMSIRAAGLFPIVQVVDNDKANQSALQRYLMEMAWYPTAALSPHIAWEEIDRNTARATMAYQGVSGAADFYFEEGGELQKIIAYRYKDSHEQARRLPCVAEIKAHHSAGAYKIPSKIEISWYLEEGKFTWYKFEVHGAEIDPIRAVRDAAV